jgi:hypothetical protein
MGNHYSHITNDHLIFLKLIGEKIARKLIQRLGTKRITMCPIREYLIEVAIKEALKSNMTIKQIAKKVGVHVSTVYRYINRMRNK